MNDSKLKCASVFAAAVLFGMAGVACAQQLTLTPRVAAPGQQVQGVLRNDTQAQIFYVRDCEVRTLRHSGEFHHISTNYQSPRSVLSAFCDQVVPLDPGESRTFTFNAPTDPGSYTIVTSDLDRVAARLVVQSATPGAQEVCFYPNGIWLAQTAHHIDFQRPEFSTWEFANAGDAAHAFGAGDRIRVFAPGSTVALADMSLAGIEVRAGGVTEVELPVVGLLPGPYTVEATFTDASAGPVVTRSGVQPRGARVDLHMYGGKRLAPGQRIEMGLGVTDYPPAGVEPFYFLMVGLQPGASPLPGGLELPLLLSDPVVGFSLSTGLGGLLVGYTGTVSNSNPFGNPFFAGGVDGVYLTGPRIPGLSGIVLRVSALTLDPRLTTWGASQPEEIVLQ